MPINMIPLIVIVIFVATSTLSQNWFLCKYNATQIHKLCLDIGKYSLKMTFSAMQTDENTTKDLNEAVLLVFLRTWYLRLNSSPHLSHQPTS